MGELGTAGKLLVTVGGALILVGGLLWLLSKLGFLGHLPGDIRIQRSGFTCLIPLVSSIILTCTLRPNSRSYCSRRSASEIVTRFSAIFRSKAFRRMAVCHSSRVNPRRSSN